MPGGFIRREPTDSAKLRRNPAVVELFTRAQWMPFCDKLRGYDDEVAEEFLQALKPKSLTLATVSFRGLSLQLTPEHISRVTELPMGLPWDKEERKWSQQAKKEFFPPEESFTEDKNGVKRTSLLPPWNEVSLQIMKYITCEGRYSIIYAYHFRLLNELRHQIDLPAAQRLSIPYFLLQSLIECSTKLKDGIPDQIAHHGLIKLLVEDALHSYKVPLAWESFRNLTREGDIKMLLEETGSSSGEEEEPVAKSKKGKSKKVPTPSQKKERKEKEEGKDDRAKEDTPILSAREQRLKSRAVKTEVVPASPSTSSAPAGKAKSKIHAAKKEKVAEVASTGTQAQASTGSPKTQKQASTGSPKTKTKASTGSPKISKEQASTGSPRATTKASTGSPKIIGGQASTGGPKTEKEASTGSPKVQPQASTGSPKTETGASTRSPRLERGASTRGPKVIEKQPPTGSPKTKKESSTGSPEVGKAGSSTGSPKSKKERPSTRSSERANRKKEKAGILEKEAAVALTALSMMSPNFWYNLGSFGLLALLKPFIFYCLCIHFLVYSCCL
jgi:hypothetical protein